MIEPGLGYIIPVLQEKFKNSKIIVLHVGKNFPARGIPTLHSCDESEVQKFLEKELPETDASFLRIIEWRPSASYYREEYLKLLSAVAEFIKRGEAEKRTVAAFGKRWFRNFFKNLNVLDFTNLYRMMDIPVIVTGSGPGLEEAMPVIKKYQKTCLVIASSSSILALSENGISPDITIATDGSPWALQHIYPFFRNNTYSRERTSFAANLCAALPSQCSKAPFLILNDGSFWQSIVLHELALPSVIIPQRGTVTASAIELALVLSRGNIFLAGMDLCVKGIRTHVRPYGFDYLFFESANRFAPVYSKSFIRSNLIHGGGSMDIYAAWFKNQIAVWPKRIFSLGGSHEIFENAFPFEQKAIKKNEYFKEVRVKKENIQPAGRGVSALLSAIKNPEYAQNLKTELAALLFPAKKEVTERELETAIIEAANG